MLVRELMPRAVGWTTPTARATAEGPNPTATTVLQIMTRGVTYCQDDDNLAEETHPSHPGSQPVEPGEGSAATLSGHYRRDLQGHGIEPDSRKSSNELT